MTQQPLVLTQKPSRERATQYLRDMLAKLKSSPTNSPTHVPKKLDDRRVTRI